MNCPIVELNYIDTRICPELGWLHLKFWKVRNPHDFPQLGVRPSREPDPVVDFEYRYSEMNCIR